MGDRKQRGAHSAAVPKNPYFNPARMTASHLELGLDASRGLGRLDRGKGRDRRSRERGGVRVSRRRSRGGRRNGRERGRGGRGDRRGGGEVTLASRDSGSRSNAGGTLGALGGRDGGSGSLASRGRRGVLGDGRVRRSNRGGRGTAWRGKGKIEEIIRRAEHRLKSRHSTR